MSNKFFDTPKEKRTIESDGFQRCCTCDIPDFMSLEMSEYKGKIYCELHIPTEHTKEQLYERYLELMKSETSLA